MMVRAISEFSCWTRRILRRRKGRTSGTSSATAVVSRTESGGDRPLQVHSDRVTKPRAARGGNTNAASIAQSMDPTDAQCVGRELCANRAGDVRPSLAPIDAAPAQRPLVPPQRGNVDFKHRQPPFPLRRDIEMPATLDDTADGDQGVGDGDAKAAGEVIIAGAALAQHHITRARNPRAPRRSSREDRQSLNRLGGLYPG